MNSHNNNKMFEINKKAKRLVKYEDIVLNPIETIKPIVSFLEVEWSISFEKYLLSRNLDLNNEHKWKQELNTKYIDIIDEILL